MKESLNEQFRRMQKIAGIITESQLSEEILNEVGMTLPIKNFLKMGEDEFKVNFVKFQNNSDQNGRSAVRNDGSFPVSVETDIKGKGPGGKFVINAYVTKEGNLDHIWFPLYDNSDDLVKQVKDWGVLRQYINTELAKSQENTNEISTGQIDIGQENVIKQYLSKLRKFEQDNTADMADLKNLETAVNMYHKELLNKIK
jgi:hypothetical protein